MMTKKQTANIPCKPAKTSIEVQACNLADTMSYWYPAQGKVIVINSVG